jgi:hypothetical protein
LRKRKKKFTGQKVSLANILVLFQISLSQFFFDWPNLFSSAVKSWHNKKKNHPFGKIKPPIGCIKTAFWKNQKRPLGSFIGRTFF